MFLWSGKGQLTSVRGRVTLISPRSWSEELPGFRVTWRQLERRTTRFCRTTRIATATGASTPTTRSAKGVKRSASRLVLTVDGSIIFNSLGELAKL